jgi:hypothetical protein
MRYLLLFFPLLASAQVAIWPADHEGAHHLNMKTASASAASAYRGLPNFVFAAYLQSTIPFREPTTKAKLGELHYSSLIGGTTGSNGKRFACLLISEQGKILAAEAGVTTRGSVKTIQALRFRVQEPGKSSELKVCGPADGALWMPAFPIPPGRQLIGFSGATGWQVDNLRFHLDDGRTSDLFGGSGGDTTFQTLLHRSAAGKLKGHLRGIWGTSNEGLESLGLLFWPIE